MKADMVVPPGDNIQTDFPHSYPQICCAVIGLDFITYTY